MPAQLAAKLGSTNVVPSVALAIANARPEALTCAQSMAPCQWDTSIPESVLWPGQTLTGSCVLHKGSSAAPQAKRKGRTNKGPKRNCMVRSPQTSFPILSGKGVCASDSSVSCTAQTVQVTALCGLMRLRRRGVEQDYGWIL